MKRFKHILYVRSNGDGDAQALNRAVELARANRARLTLTDVIEQDEGLISGLTAQPTLDRLQDELTASRQESLKSLTSQLLERYTDLEISMVVSRGMLAEQLIRTVIEWEIDLVIKAPEPAGDGTMARLFGSADMKLMRKCPCAVWLSRGDQPARYRRILAAIDLEGIEPQQQELQDRIMAISTSLAASESCELLLCHAWRLAAEGRMRGRQVSEVMVERLLQDIEKTLSQKLVEVQQEHPYERTAAMLIKGRPGDVIAQQVKQHDIDLVIIGTVGRTGISGLIIGNTAERVLSAVECSVLTLKPAGFVSPLAV